MGTSVVSGSGTAVVVATGASNYLGSQQQDLPRDQPQTSFERGVREVGWMLISFMVVCGPLVLAVNASVRGHPLAVIAKAGPEAAPLGRASVADPVT
jgi:Mg2+-importing ATPase